MNTRRLFSFSHQAGNCMLNSSIFLFFFFLFGSFQKYFDSFFVYINSPNENPTSPVIVQQQTILTNSNVTPKWPLKPGVLVHANGARFNQGLATSLTNLQKTSNPSGLTNVTSGSNKSRCDKKIWNLQKGRRRRTTISLGSVTLPDDTNQKTRVLRIKKMFSQEKTDSLPNGFYHGKSGGNNNNN